MISAGVLRVKKELSRQQQKHEKLPSMQIVKFYFQHTPEEVNGQCGCYHGYYGSACEMQCAGGANYPCYGKGECNTETGTCQCDPSANVNDNCSVCNDGWFGEDCSVAYSGLQGTASISVQGANSFL